MISNWKNAVTDLQDWHSKQEKKLAAQGSPASDLESIQKQKITFEVRTYLLMISAATLRLILQLN